MSINTNANFTRLVEHLQAQGPAALQRTEDTQEYRDFLAAFPLERLNQLTLDEYCVGKGEQSFSWWLEVGLTPVLGRYMPGTSRGHILYLRKDGSVYRIKNFDGLSDDDALRYTLKVQSAIAAADPDEDLRWVDDDAQIFQRAGVDPLVTVAEGRKLRLLSCYHPSDTLPISSSAHLAHFLVALGFPEADVPPFRQPVARMLLLRDYYLKACEQVPGLSTYGFMRGLYSEEVWIAPTTGDSVSDEQDMQFVPIKLEHGDRLDWSRVTHVRHLGREADTPKAQESLDFIAEHMDEDGVTAIGELEKDFPGRLRSTKGQLGGMRFDLRHFANDRESGNNPQDKGLVELGYLVPVGVPPSRPTYLLTWNPDYGKDGGSAGVTPGEVVSWTCHSKQPQPGDVVYLIRLGQPPRGIVARGLVTEGAHDAPGWHDETTTRRYIRFRVEESRSDCAAGLLPMVLLHKAFSQQKWSPQRSGIAIEPRYVAELNRLWQAGEGKHSLRQFVEWSKATSSEFFPDWLPRYRSTTEFASAIKKGEQPLDEPALKRLWLEPDNGVFAVGSGLMPKVEFSRNLDWLRDITEKVIADPSLQGYESIELQWRAAVEKGLFARMKQALCTRQFSTFDPEALTTILWNSDCAFLLQALKEQFQLSAEFADDWFSLNQGIMQCLRMAGVDADTPLENNIAIRLLQLSLTEKPADIKEDGDEDDDMTGSKSPLNQILFGPPGTGKTYATIDRALEILDPALVAKTDVTREALTTAFKRFIDNGQVVFCTFHQSFSYEDFVEGLRAETVDGALHYRVESGLFKKLCERASLGRPAVDDPFDQALKVLSERLEANDGRLTLSTSKGKVFEVEYAGGLTFLVFPKSNEELKNGYTGNMELVRKLYQTGSKEGIYNSSYVDGMLDYLRKECGLPEYQPSVIPASQRDKFVLIIDEINRGSLSRIFGELITLIEPSKRSGEQEALEVSLPYSKKPFSVPANLYLIGTMNTADRSLAGLDIALRRRFTFVEMPPKPDLLDDVLVEDVSVGQLLRVMNQRIEVLLDRDHCLGHAYFLPLKIDPSLALLGGIFRNQIMPLLQEYFFEDWERIAWVLNDQQATSSMPFLQKPESEMNLAALFGSAVAGKLNDQRWELNDQAFGSIDSYRNILG